jgi:DNA-3-methyladenine glycosylase II
MSLAIRPVAPFDFSRSLGFLEGFGPMRDEQTLTPSTLTKALSCDGRAVGFRVRQKGGVERPTLDVELFSEHPLGAGLWRDVLGRVQRLLTTGDDLAPFYALAAKDPAMAPLLTELRGLHHVTFPSAFEAACWGVINQRIGMGAARKMKDALVRRAGVNIAIDGVEHWAFPEPAAVLALGEPELARLLPGGRRAAAVLAVARAFLTIDEAFLRDAPLGEARAWLRAIHGVGPFTSGFVLYRALGRFDGAAVVSPKLVAAAERRYERALTQGDVEKLIEGYGEWGGYWMLYTWASGFLVPRSKRLAS